MKLEGIVHQHDVDKRGLREIIDAGREDGSIDVVGRWYVHEGANEDIRPYLAAGRRPTCLDAAAMLGLWVPNDTGVHVYAPRCGPRTDTSELQLPPLRTIHRPQDEDAPEFEDVLVHAPVLRGWPDHDPVPDVDVVIAHAARCQSTESVAVLLESALNSKKLTLARARALVADLPSRMARSLRHLHTDAQSGTETMVRRWFEARGVTVRSQANIPEVGRVDMLVGTNWIIECDSRQYHTGEEQYAKDHARDLAAASRGYRVTRLTWSQVVMQWKQTEARLEKSLRRRDHHRQRRA
jgi:very-short-patch-repair endonuclease